jgi:hypothetical protein
MAGDLTAFADNGVFLDFHKGADFGFISHFAAIQVDEAR